MSAPITRIAVTGRGVVAWAAAAAFAARLRGVQVIVVEDTSAPPSLADLVGSATPSITDFHHDARIDEHALMRIVDSGFRLGSRFSGWNTGLPAYLHCYGEHGAGLAGAPFHQHWLRLRGSAGDFADYSPASVMARAGSFVHPSDDPDSPLSRFGYGLQLDLAGYAAWLRGTALSLGVTAVAGPGTPRLDSATGRVEALTLPDGRELSAELYVDTTGALADAVDPARTDWSHWLPAAHIAVGRSAARGVSDGPASVTARNLTGNAGRSAPLAQPPLVDEVRATATGWHLTAPLRTARLAAAVSTAPIDDPALPVAHAFTQGHRRRPWHANVVAIGDAALVLEPLEGVSLHIAHAHIDRLIASLPGRDFAAVETADYNRQTLDEAARLRDFLILHYATANRPEPLWRDLAAATPPPALADDLKLFRARGHLRLHDGESFTPDSWLAVLIGQGVIPRRTDPVADELPRQVALRELGAMRMAVAAAVAGVRG